MIEEQFVSFDTAKLLKEAGFDVPCYMQYSERGVQWNASSPENFNADDWGCSCPTQALAARWLREVHGIHVGSDMAYIKLMEGKWMYLIRFTDDCGNPYKSCGWFDSYEEALEAGLKSGLELIKNKDYEEDNVQ